MLECINKLFYLKKNFYEVLNYNHPKMHTYHLSKLIAPSRIIICHMISSLQNSTLSYGPLKNGYAVSSDWTLWLWLLLLAYWYCFFTRIAVTYLDNAPFSGKNLPCVVIWQVLPSLFLFQDCTCNKSLV